MNPSNFFRDHFDKLLLFSILCVLLGISTHFAHWGDMDSAHWYREQSKEVIGALLILMTGRGIAALAQAKPVEPPPLPPVEKKPDA